MQTISEGFSSHSSGENFSSYSEFDQSIEEDNPKDIKKTFTNHSLENFQVENANEYLKKIMNTIDLSQLYVIEGVFINNDQQ